MTLLCPAAFLSVPCITRDDVLVFFIQFAACMRTQLEAKRQISTQQLQAAFETLRVDIEAAAATFKNVEEACTYTPVLEGLGERVHTARVEVENLRKAESLFGLEASDFEQLDAVGLLFDRLNEVSKSETR